MNRMEIRCKDFIETPEGLIFAVVVEETEQGRHLCFLRYRAMKNGYRKVSTEEANRLLASDFPQYIYHSSKRDADLHGVEDKFIKKHHQATKRLAAIVSGECQDPFESKLAYVTKLLEQGGLHIPHLGVTGSLLIGAQTANSDIDIVVYGRENYRLVRSLIRLAISEKTLAPLSDSLWKESYRRRDCSLSLKDYLWHERRKNNKASYSGTKIDFSLVSEPGYEKPQSFRKIKAAKIQARVTDSSDAFDHPARYQIEHPEISEIASFTPTYTGQAMAGETVIARGMLEESDCGMRRLVVGSNREAPGEYIKVIRTLA